MITHLNTRIRRAIAACGLALAAAPALAWNAQPTPVNFLNEEGLNLSAQLFVPVAPAVNGSYPAVVMLHGCSGAYNDSGGISNIYREWADRLTAAGYVALLVDSFTPRNTPDQCGNGAGVGVSEIFDRPKDAVAAYQYLTTANLGVAAARVGLLGWSHGGSTVMSTLATTDPVNTTSASALATGSPFRVGVAFYPGGGLSDSRCGTYNGAPKSCWKGLSTSVWDSYAPLFIHHGTADTTTSLSNVQTRVTKAQSQAGGASVSLTAYTDAQHKFDDPGTGGGACTATTPNACAKQAADPVAMAAFQQYLQQ